MNRRAFLALVGASASAGMLPTRKVSPVLIPPLASHYLTDQNEWWLKPGDTVWLRPGTYGQGIVESALEGLEDG